MECIAVVPSDAAVELALLPQSLLCPAETGPGVCTAQTGKLIWLLKTGEGF